MSNVNFGRAAVSRCCYLELWIVNHQQLSQVRLLQKSGVILKEYGYKPEEHEIYQSLVFLAIQFAWSQVWHPRSGQSCSFVMAGSVAEMSDFYFFLVGVLAASGSHLQSAWSAAS